MCELRIVCLQFVVIVLKVIYIRLDKGRTRSAFSMLVEVAICLLILYTEWPYSDKLKSRMGIN